MQKIIWQRWVKERNTLRRLHWKLSHRFAVYSILFMCLHIFYAADAIQADRFSQEKRIDPIGIDFCVYYTAGKMVLSGDAGNVYNIPKHHALLEEVLQREIPSLIPWVYPPTFLLAVTPLASLPYDLALTLWLAVTFALALWAIYLLLPRHHGLALLIGGFPGFFMNVKWGQNGFLSTAFIGFGIYFIETSPALAGLMFGLLSYKIQFILFPLFLLLVLKKWRVLSWTLFFASATSVISGVLFGSEVWAQFIQSIVIASSILLDQNWWSLASVRPSVHTMLRFMGASNSLSYVIQGAVGCGALIIVRSIWRKTDRLALKGSSLSLGILLSTPYFIQYDLVILSIPLTLLIFDCMENGYHQYERVLLWMLWLLPMVNWPLVRLTSVQICPFILAAVLWMTFVRAARGQAQIQ